MVELVKHIAAAEFLDYFRPSSGRWWNGFTGRRSHVFRGHSDAGWQLRPKGWRPLERNPEVSALYRAVCWTLAQCTEPHRLPHDQQATFWRFALAEAAIQFASLGRSFGLEIPWHVGNSLLTSPRSVVPHIELSLLALAQHHGIPTQLLDWSDDPLTAAFFAVDDGDEQQDLCVWALEIDGISKDENSHVRLTRAPNIGNSNMRAQSGVFLAYDQGPHLDVIFNGSWPSFESHDYISRSLSKVTLPGRQRQALRDLLLKENRSRAHLMPSWDNVAHTLQNDWTTSVLWSGDSPLMSS